MLYANAAKDGDTSAKKRLMTLGCALVKRAVSNTGAGSEPDLSKPMLALEDYAAGRKEIGGENIKELCHFFDIFKLNYSDFSKLVRKNDKPMIAQALIGGLVNSICRFDAHLQSRLGIWSVPYGTMAELLLEFVPFVQGKNDETGLGKWYLEILEGLPTA